MCDAEASFSLIARRDASGRDAAIQHESRLSRSIRNNRDNRATPRLARQRSAALGRVVITAAVQTGYIGNRSDREHG